MVRAATSSSPRCDLTYALRSGIWKSSRSSGRSFVQLSRQCATRRDVSAARTTLLPLASQTGVSGRSTIADLPRMRSRQDVPVRAASSGWRTEPPGDVVDQHDSVAANRQGQKQLRHSSSLFGFAILELAPVGDERDDGREQGFAAAGDIGIEQEQARARRCAVTDGRKQCSQPGRPMSRFFEREIANDLQNQVEGRQPAGLGSVGLQRLAGS